MGKHFEVIRRFLFLQKKNNVLKQLSRHYVCVVDVVTEK